VATDGPQPIGRLVGRTHKFVRAWGDRELAPLGASVTDWILLFHISQVPDPGMRQIDIARFSDMTGPALVRYLDRYEAEGLIRRRRDSEDRRAVRVTLTPAGESRLAELKVVMDRCDRRLRALLTEDEQQTIARALDKVFQFAIGELHEEEPA
jgi:MarR family transcriptional regulator for hemolysin